MLTLALFRPYFGLILALFWLEARPSRSAESSVRLAEPARFGRARFFPARAFTNFITLAEKMTHMSKLMMILLV